MVYQNSNLKTPRSLAQQRDTLIYCNNIINIGNKKSLPPPIHTSLNNKSSAGQQINKSLKTKNAVGTMKFLIALYN